MKFAHRKPCVSFWIAGLSASVVLLLTQLNIGLRSEAAAQSSVGLTGSSQVGHVRLEADELFAYAHNYAASRGYRFGSGADVMLRERLANLSPVELDAARLDEAKRNIERFVDAMIAASNEIPNYSDRSPAITGETRSSGIIGEQTFAIALRRMCPIWPICR